MIGVYSEHLETHVMLSLHAEIEEDAACQSAVRHEQIESAPVPVDRLKLTKLLSMPGTIMRSFKAVDSDTMTQGKTQSNYGHPQDVHRPY